MVDFLFSMGYYYNCRLCYNFIIIQSTRRIKHNYTVGRCLHERAADAAGKMRRIKLIVKLTAVMLLAAILSGCSTTAFGVDNYMRPPAASGDSAEIQQVLEEHIGLEYTLRYPRSGEYRSAVVMADIDSDSYEEAIVFYRLATERAGANMLVIDRQSKRWIVSGQTPGGGEIDRVMLGDINGDGAREIITGWSGGLDSGTLRVHSLEDGVLHEIKVVTDVGENYPADQYYEMAMGDFDADAHEEIMTIYRSPSEGIAVARMLHLSCAADGSARLTTVGEMNTDGSVQEYLNAQAGFTSLGCFCMITDGRRASGEYVTEVIAWDKENDSLVSLLAGGEEGAAIELRRTQATLSQDINGDGMIELPVDRLLPGYTERSALPMYLTLWYNVGRGDASLAMQTVIRFDHGYYITFESQWTGKITVQPDTDSAIMYFYRVGESGDFTQELFRIKIFTLDEWDDRRESIADALIPGYEAPDYQRLAVTDYYVYGVLISPAAQEMGIDADAVGRNFHLYS